MGTPTRIQFLDSTARIHQVVSDSGFPEIDHVELFAPSATPGVASRNFVLCPGKADDRSPGGTGAKPACLAADGKLAPGVEWEQESIIGSAFRGKYRGQGDKLIPTLIGAAFVMAEGTLLQDPQDSFQTGIR